MFLQCVIRCVSELCYFGRAVCVLSVFLPRTCVTEWWNVERVACMRKACTTFQCEAPQKSVRCEMSYRGNIWRNVNAVFIGKYLPTFAVFCIDFQGTVFHYWDLCCSGLSRGVVNSFRRFGINYWSILRVNLSKKMKTKTWNVRCLSDGVRVASLLFQDVVVVIYISTIICHVQRTSWWNYCLVWLHSCCAYSAFGCAAVAAYFHIQQRWSRLRGLARYFCSLATEL